MIMMRGMIMMCGNGTIFHEYEFVLFCPSSHVVTRTAVTTFSLSFEESGGR